MFAIIPEAFCVGARAADAEAPDDVQSVTVTKGVLVAVMDGKSIEVTNEISMPKGIVVDTNATFKVGGGKARRLTEGQILARDGRLTSPDGSVTPVEDHVTARAGHVVIVRDGDASPLTAPLTLKDGVRVYPDGRMVTPSNVTRRLLDGQIVRLNETGIEATDTARLEQGKVVLFKDGGRIELHPGQVMAMSDGSRIDARGVILKRDGSQIRLKEGELYKFAGAGDTR